MIRTSKQVKQQLEQIQKQEGFKSIDAVLRYLLSARIRITGGIFLGTENRHNQKPIDLHNTRNSVVESNYENLFISKEETIDLVQCLHCGNIIVVEEERKKRGWDGNVTIFTNCGCGHGMARIKIKVEP